MRRSARSRRGSTAISPSTWGAAATMGCGSAPSAPIFPSRAAFAPMCSRRCGRCRCRLLRWPGGCYADHYHWRDGIGPRARAPGPPGHVVRPAGRGRQQPGHPRVSGLLRRDRRRAVPGRQCRQRHAAGAVRLAGILQHRRATRRLARERAAQRRAAALRREALGRGQRELGLRRQLRRRDLCPRVSSATPRCCATSTRPPNWSSAATTTTGTSSCSQTIGSASRSGRPPVDPSLLDHTAAPRPSSATQEYYTLLAEAEATEDVRPAHRRRSSRDADRRRAAASASRWTSGASGIPRRATGGRGECRAARRSPMSRPARCAMRWRRRSRWKASTASAGADAGEPGPDRQRAAGAGDDRGRAHVADADLPRAAAARAAYRRDRAARR